MHGLANPKKKKKDKIFSLSLETKIIFVSSADYSDHSFCLLSPCRKYDYVN